MLSRYLAGAATARTGDEMSGPALLLLGLTVTGSPIAASALLAGLTVSSAVGGPMFGTLLDRSNRPGRLLAVTLAAYALGLGAILASLGHLPIVAVVALAVLTGLFNPAVAGGWTAQLPHVLGARGLTRGTALDALTFDVASLTGPALAALIADRLGAPAALATAVGLVVLALPSAWSLPATAPSTGKTAWTAGFRAILAYRPLLRATVTSTLSYVGVGMFVVCLPLLGERRFGAATLGTLLLTVVAVASLFANGLLVRKPWPWRQDTLLLGSTLLLAASYALAILPGFAVVFAAVLTGIGEGPQLVALMGIRHREAPAELRGRVFTTGASLKVTGFAGGSALAGPLAAHSLTVCLCTAAAMELLAAAAYPALRTPSPARAA
ncbi:MFS transporter [Amycolatopsis sp.]|uniref:MFS transporter n=1 Tax=Amycolatopsis sp. TaxID=37632 RepID=UPI002C86E0FF|nr:MFS transporter [Amycolatopsis sp.]HVV08699.1 MFS transporter [Amycolatopsis sp.]